VTAGLCECGCGRATQPESDWSKAGEYRRFASIQCFNRRGEAADERAIARYTGAADARNGRPRQVDIADTSDIGAAYTRGYDAPDAWRYER